MLAFSILKRSNKIKLLLWRLIPYKIPSLELRLEETKGNVVERGEELRLVLTSISSLARGKVEEYPCSIRNTAAFM